jgi:hypothetical protein
MHTVFARNVLRNFRFDLELFKRSHGFFLLMLPAKEA